MEERKITVITDKNSFNKVMKVFKEPNINITQAATMTGKSKFIEHINKIKSDYKDTFDIKLDVSRKNPCPPTHIKTRNKRR